MRYGLRFASVLFMCLISGVLTSSTFAQNRKVDFIPPGPEERGVAPEFVIWISGLWAAIENYDSEIHFFETRGSGPLRYLSSAPFAAGGYITEIVSVQDKTVKVRLANNETKDITVTTPPRSRAEANTVLQEVGASAEITGEPGANGSVSFSIPPRTLRVPGGRPEAAPSFTPLSFTLAPLLENSQIRGWSVVSYLVDRTLILFWSEAQTVSGRIVTRSFVGRFDTQGTLRSGLELPTLRASIPTDLPVAASPTGQVVYMSIEKKFQLIALTLKPTAQLKQEVNAPARRNEILRLPQFGQSGGAEAASRLASLPIVKRADIKPVLDSYLDVAVTTTDVNFRMPGSARNCTGSNMWLPPERFVPGQSISRMAYAWGKLDTPAEYKSRIAAGKLIGDICGPQTYKSRNGGRSCPNGTCVIDQSAGVDCSGLVSRAWVLPEKYGTATLPDISTRLRDKKELLNGDILLKNGHVMVVEYVKSTPSRGLVFGIVESASGTGGVMRHEISENGAAPYSPYRYRKIQD